MAAEEDGGSKPSKAELQAAVDELKKKRKKEAAQRKAAKAAAAQAKPAPRPRKKLTEPLLEMTPYEQSAIALNEAMNSQCYLEYPTDRFAWESYSDFHSMDGWLQLPVLGLLVLTVFETPLWCNSEGKWYWNWEPAQERCTAARGIPKEEIIMSGVMMLPSGIGAIVEYTLLVTILVRNMLIFRLEYAFKDCGGVRTTGEVVFSFFMIILGLVDAAIYWVNPGNRFRIAPYVRFGLAASIPWVRDLLVSFWGVLAAISKVFTFLMGTVVAFAWVLAMIFDDLTFDDPYGNPVNTGFETFGNALYTSFATMTTAVTPDSMIPSYSYSRNMVLLWLPFLVLATVIFNNVLLARVYGEYQAQYTRRVKVGMDRRDCSLEAAFQMVRERTRSLENGYSFDVRFETFVQVAKMLRSFQPISADDRLLRLVYEALDANSDGTLDNTEFFFMCDVLQTSFKLTRRDSWLRCHFGAGSRVGRALKSLMDNGAEEPDFGYDFRFQGSKFDTFMNIVLTLNVIWVLLESAVDLNNIEEPDCFQLIDVFFSLIYLLEVGLKLSYWSWDEYRQNNDNCFDFVTTMILAASAFGYLFFEVDRNMLRYLNLLRLVRLLKALNNIAAYREVWSVVQRMLRTCSGVLAMNFLVIYLWSSVGVQLFGGRLLKSDPRLEGQAYFDSHYEVYNFNDMFMGMITLYYFTLGTWIDPIACACMALAERYSLEWFLNYAFLLTFYVASPLLAFNVFTSFTIDVFINLQEMDTNGSNEVKSRLSDMQGKLAEEGWCLHIQESEELSRAKVMRKMFGDS